MDPAVQVSSAVPLFGHRTALLADAVRRPGLRRGDRRSEGKTSAREVHR